MGIMLVLCKDITPTMDNRLEDRMEDQKETAIIHSPTPRETPSQGPRDPRVLQRTHLPPYLSAVWAVQGLGCRASQKHGIKP